MPALNNPLIRPQRSLCVDLANEPKDASRSGRGRSATLTVPEDGAYRPDMPTDDHALVNRATWDEDARTGSSEDERRGLGRNRSGAGAILSPSFTCCLI